MISATDPETGEPVDRSVMEEAGVAFVPEAQHMDLSKEEKRRTTALMMAIQAYKNLIIPDAAYLDKAADLARRGEGPKISPATIDAMVDAAIKFDYMIATGKMLSFVKRETPEVEEFIAEPGRPAATEEETIGDPEA